MNLVQLAVTDTASSNATDCTISEEAEAEADFEPRQKQSRSNSAFPVWLHPYRCRLDRQGRARPEMSGNGDDGL
jgi:hypothetical protein